MKRRLIVSPWAYKDNNSKDIFLGRWAIPYSKFEKNINLKVLQYHWDDRNKAYKDSIYLSNLRKLIIKEISIELNKVHKINISERSWNLIIGFWLIRFLSVSYDRWCMLEIANQNFKELSSFYNKEDKRELVPSDTKEASKQFRDDYWNYHFINNLITHFPSIEIKQIDKNVDLYKKVKKPFFIEIYNTFEKRAKIYANRLFSLLLKCLKFEKDNFLISDPHLSLKSLIKLSLKLKGVTNYHQNFLYIKKYSYDNNYRNWELKSKCSYSKFENVVRDLIPKFMPTIFLEGFKRHYLDQSIYKRSTIPRIIFTSNKHISDDAFKILVTRFIEKGSNLIIGNHGGGSPLLFNDSKDYEAEVADYFLVTGSHNQIYKNSYNVGQFWARLKNNIYDSDGHLLIITGIHPRYAIEIHSYALSSQILNYFQDLFSFYKKLPKNISSKTEVRLYPNNYGWEEEKRWKDNCGDIKIANKREKLSKQIKKCRLAVTTYNASTYIELLAANIPVIIFWDETVWQCCESSKIDFALLERVGIFHKTPHSASKMVEKVWNKIDLWWKSENLQKVRREFCEKYGNRELNSKAKIINIFEEALKH
tara:strand:+ start:3670 stop:5442 length:1773 start_codon:yes stop_codon:yes gene_type:complete